MDDGEAEMRPSIVDLPPPVLGAIFSAALPLHQAVVRGAIDSAQDKDTILELRRKDPRRVLPLVCKSFLAACEHAAQLWQRVQLSVLTLSAERLPCFVSWLAGHAPALRALVLHGRPLPTVEAALREQAGALAAALQAARGLRELELCRPLGAAVLARVDPLRLPCLRSVGVDFAAVGASRSGGGRGQRAQEAGEAEAATVNLMRLPALSELLLLSCLDAALLARGPSLPPLQRVHFADTRDLPRTPALGPLAALHALSALRYSQRDGLALPGPLTALRALAYLHAAVRYRDDPLRVGPDLAALPSLRGLWLQHAVLEEPSCLGALPALSALGLVGCADAYPDVLHALALSTRLRALHLEAHATATAEVPPEAWRRLAAVGPGLTRLEMPHNRLRELPPGAYLESLQVLDVSHNSLPGVPHALAASTCLRCISVAQQDDAAPGGEEGDVDVLRALCSHGLHLLVTSAGRYYSTYAAVGLRSPVEQAHLERLRGALPPAVRVTNQQAEFERVGGRLAALFEVNLQHEKL